MALPADASVLCCALVFLPLLGLWKVVRGGEHTFRSRVASALPGTPSPSLTSFELSFTAPVWLSIISVIQEGRLGQRQMKLFAEGHTAILWQCCSAAFQRCLRGKVVLSPSKVPKGGVSALPPPSLSSVFEQSEILWTGEASWLQTCCQINSPCLCVRGAAWQESAGAKAQARW